MPLLMPHSRNSVKPIHTLPPPHPYPHPPRSLISAPTCATDLFFACPRAHASAPRPRAPLPAPRTSTHPPPPLRTPTHQLEHPLPAPTRAKPPSSPSERSTPRQAPTLDHQPAS